MNALGFVTSSAPPQILLTEGRPWLSHLFEEWTATHGIEHQVAPGEAHEAVVDRRHAPLKKICGDLLRRHQEQNRRWLERYRVPQILEHPQLLVTRRLNGSWATNHS